MARILRYDVKTFSILLRRHSNSLTHQQRRQDVHLLKNYSLLSLPICRELSYTSRLARAISRRIDVRFQHTAATTSDQIIPKTNTEAEEGEAPQPPLAIVFTDIVKSTAIWEKNTPAMSQAMVIHDDLIRKLTNTYGGYEVKQNGDGFMIAFQHAVPALKFCLDIQLQLQDQKWPQELLKLGPASPVIKTEEDQGDDELRETVLWRGLRLRMSAHFGEPLCVWNDVIHRMDYLGPAVNLAARYVSVCEGGQIIVSEQFLDELNINNQDSMGGDGPLFNGVQSQDLNFQDFDLKELSSDQTVDDVADTKFEVLELGERRFKGIPEQQKLFVIMPKSLHGRLDYFPRQLYVQPSKGNLV